MIACRIEGKRHYSEVKIENKSEAYGCVDGWVGDRKARERIGNSGHIECRSGRLARRCACHFFCIFVSMSLFSFLPLEVADVVTSLQYLVISLVFVGDTYIVA